MSTYIFDYVEIKENNKWKLYDGEFDNVWFDKDKPVTDFNQPKSHHLYDGQNYELFSILADVRNWEGIDPIAYPKGIPRNASKDYKECAEEGEHSHSYFTLHDLLKFKWDKTHERNSIVEEEDYLIFKEKGKLPYSSQGMNGPDVFRIPDYLMDEVINGEFNQKMLLLEAKKIYRMMREERWHSGMLERQREIVKKVKNYDFNFDFQTMVTWKETYRETTGEEWFKILEQLKSLAPEGNYKNIRYLFFFIG